MALHKYQFYHFFVCFAHRSAAADVEIAYDFNTMAQEHLNPVMNLLDYYLPSSPSPRTNRQLGVFATSIAGSFHQAVMTLNHKP